MAKIIELIFTEEMRGSGKQDDPYRLIPQLWSKDGRLIAENDDIKKLIIFNRPE